MWIVLDQFSRTLIDAAVANAILLSVVVVVVVFTRQPARRIMLAQTGVYAALVMIPLVAFDFLPRSYPVDALLRTGLVPPPLTPEPDPLDLVGPLAPGPAGRVVPRGRPAASQAEWPAGERLVRVATLLYLAGASLGLAWFGLGLWGFRRLLGRSTAASPATCAVFEELIADLERSPPQPALRISTWLRSPVLGGVTRPTIVIPAELDGDEVDRDALRLILLHELAHADRGDAWFNALAALAQIVWFFLPHLWWLRAQLRIDQEFLADRKAAGPLGESTHYARWLVGLSSGRAGRAVATRKPEAAAPDPSRTWGGRGFDTPLLQRVAMLLYCPFVVEGRPPRWFAIGVPAGFMLAAVMLSTLRILAPVDPSALLYQAQDRDPLVRTFSIPEFDVVPSSPPRTPQYFPLALPPAFRLEAFVIATPTTLTQLRIAGCPLVPDARGLAFQGPPRPQADDETPSRHRYTLRREYRTLKAAIDKREFDLDPKILDDVQWLTITPGDEIATILGLGITW
ncbi:M56 family metallopeptidase [Paludisphaera mucosa]|uniref:M56 family metallopeptidase n=1 Tax=Paludisphaera mucosa TaxID=3030827 RepID=A0ABT6F4D5_9BACT|nr:M56 family metallopeptidase [Paludisphaera mucosa]MDG3002452.1 M56 family metallopeptidase [Paludisphaera mucosa]